MRQGGESGKKRQRTAETFGFVDEREREFEYSVAHFRRLSPRWTPHKWTWAGGRKALFAKGEKVRWRLRLGGGR